MTYSLNAQAAKQADSINSSIRETGKFIGIITRAEALTSEKKTKGLGLSFKTDGGETADYLDLYTHTADGKELPSLKTVNAIMACLKVKQLPEGPISFERWDKDQGQRVKVTKPGYPDLMNKRIGFLFRKVLDTNTKTGADRENVEIFAVFQADTELTATEILDQKTSPERLGKMLDALMAKPVYDKRQPAATRAAATSASSAGQDWADNDIPF